jgi:hypothetical protein
MVIPRCWKKGDCAEALGEFLAQPLPRRAAIRELMKELLAENPYARRSAADFARRVSAREPGILRNYAKVLIDLMAETPLDQWQARGYLALAAALNAVKHAERMSLVPAVRAMIDDERNAVRAMGLEAFATLAIAEPELREEAMILLDHARREGTCAMQSRARRMLPQVAAAEVNSRA